MNVGWEGNGERKTMSLTLFLTCIWLWVLHHATLIELPCSEATRTHTSTCSISRLWETEKSWRLFYRKYLGLWHPHWDDGTQVFKGSSEFPVRCQVYLLEDIDPLQPRGRRRAHAAARRRSVCHDLALPEKLGKVSETAQSSSLDQVANYKADWLYMHTWFIWRLTAGDMGFVLCTNISWFLNDH